ncbi:MAG: helix-turn-helix domain-containing protein [candidate division NC10 bacterium]|nr:helix-turn-helix domain-containing protein [candidate division NC10 bacterium]
MTERLLTIPEAADRLALAPATLRKWLSLRHLNCVRIGRAVRLRDSDVEAMARVGFDPKRAAGLGQR